MPQVDSGFCCRKVCSSRLKDGSTCIAKNLIAILSYDEGEALRDLSYAVGEFTQRGRLQLKRNDGVIDVVRVNRMKLLGIIEHSEAQLGHQSVYTNVLFSPPLSSK